MQIWTLRSMLQLMLRLALVVIAHLAAGKWSATSGNGQPPTSSRSLDLRSTPTKTIRSLGLENEKSCAAGAGQRAHGSPDRATGISSLPIAMTSFLGSGPAPFSHFSRAFSRGLLMRVLARVGQKSAKHAPRCQSDTIIP